MSTRWIDHDRSSRAPVSMRDVIDVVYAAEGASAGLTLDNIDWSQVISYRVYDEPDDRDLVDYARRLATIAANKAGCDENWKPLNDISGCLMQIDNAMTGLVAKPDFMDSPRGWLIKDEFDADPEAWFHTVHEDQAREYAKDGTPVFALPDFKQVSPVSPDADLLEEAVGRIKRLEDILAVLGDEASDAIDANDLNLIRKTTLDTALYVLHDKSAFLSKVGERGHD